MKKALFFFPAAVYTAASIALSMILNTFSALWYAWAALLWLGGFFLTKGKAWGGGVSLIPAVHLLYMSTQYRGQAMNIEMPLGIVTAVYVLACILLVWKNGRQNKMKKFDAAHPLWNRILAVVYLPLVFLCYLGLMAGERAIGETNLLIIISSYLLAHGLFGVALTTYPALILSGKCFAKGKRLWGHLLRWYPVWMAAVLAFVGDFLLYLSGA